MFIKCYHVSHTPSRDLVSEVTPEEGEKRAKDLNVMFIETSAKAGHNVGYMDNNPLAARETKSWC